MTISLTHEQQARLTAYVERGDFASVEDAAGQLIDERIAERSIEEGDDLAWAKPYAEAALQEAAQQRLISHDEYRNRNTARIADLKG